MRTSLALSKIFPVNKRLDPVLEITHFISQWVKSVGYYPTMLFTNVIDYPDFQIVMNLFKRHTFLHRIGVFGDDYVRQLAHRYLEVEISNTSGSIDGYNSYSSLGKLPLMMHQPRESGRYLTSFITSLVDPESGYTNLGFYRAYVKDVNKLVIFMDPRTDAHKIVNKYYETGEKDIPITLFNGGPLPVYLAAASAIPVNRDTFSVAASLNNDPLCLLYADYPAAPIDSEIIIHGRLCKDRAKEGPFGEFKGYYHEGTESPVIEIDEVLSREKAIMMGLFCGKESGLTLMSLQNEYMLYSHLLSKGFSVDNIRCPLSSFGEFLTLIQCSNPNKDILNEAMKFDKRTKTIIVSKNIDEIEKELSVNNFIVHVSDYVKHGVRQGNRLGIIVERAEDYIWSEY